MLKFVAIVALILFARRLRRVKVDVHHHYHFPSGGPGERRPEDNWLILEPAGGNVVPFRRRA